MCIITHTKGLLEGPRWENVHRILRQKMEWSRRFFPASDGSSKLQASSFFLRRTISNGYEPNIHFGSNDQLTIDPNYWDTFHCCRCAIFVRTIPSIKDLDLADLDQERLPSGSLYYRWHAMY